MRHKARLLTHLCPILCTLMSMCLCFTTYTILTDTPSNPHPKDTKNCAFLPKTFFFASVSDNSLAIYSVWDNQVTQQYYEDTESKNKQIVGLEGTNNFVLANTKLSIIPFYSKSQGITKSYNLDSKSECRYIDTMGDNSRFVTLSKSSQQNPIDLKSKTEIWDRTLPDENSLVLSSWDNTQDEGFMVLVAQDSSRLLWVAQSKKELKVVDSTNGFVQEHSETTSNKIESMCQSGASNSQVIVMTSNEIFIFDWVSGTVLLTQPGGFNQVATLGDSTTDFIALDTQNKKIKILKISDFSLVYESPTQDNDKDIALCSHSEKSYIHGSTKAGKETTIKLEFCSAPCSSCDEDTPSQCTACVQPLMLRTDNTCQATCTPGDGLKSPGICQNCQIDGLLLEEGNCVESCRVGYYNDGGICKECYTQCRKCSGPSNTQCLSCKTGTFLHQNQCLISCPNNLFGDISTNSCQSCIPKCQSCLDISECEICKAPFFEHLGLCLDSCPPGYRPTNTNASCEEEIIIPLTLIPDNLKIQEKSETLIYGVVSFKILQNNEEENNELFNRIVSLGNETEALLTPTEETTLSQPTQHMGIIYQGNIKPDQLEIVFRLGENKKLQDLCYKLELKISSILVEEKIDDDNNHEIVKPISPVVTLTAFIDLTVDIGITQARSVASNFQFLSSNGNGTLEVLSGFFSVVFSQISYSMVVAMLGLELVQKLGFLEVNYNPKTQELFDQLIRNSNALTSVSSTKERRNMSSGKLTEFGDPEFSEFGIIKMLIFIFIFTLRIPIRICLQILSRFPALGEFKKSCVCFFYCIAIHRKIEFLAFQYHVLANSFLASLLITLSTTKKREVLPIFLICSYLSLICSSLYLILLFEAAMRVYKLSDLAPRFGKILEIKNEKKMNFSKILPVEKPRKNTFRKPLGLPRAQNKRATAPTNSKNPKNEKTDFQSTRKIDFKLTIKMHKQDFLTELHILNEYTQYLQLGNKKIIPSFLVFLPLIYMAKIHLYLTIIPVTSKFGPIVLSTLALLEAIVILTYFYLIIKTFRHSRTCYFLSRIAHSIGFFFVIFSSLVFDHFGIFGNQVFFKYTSYYSLVVCLHMEYVLVVLVVLIDLISTLRNCQKKTKEKVEYFYSLLFFQEEDNSNKKQFDDQGTIVRRANIKKKAVRRFVTPGVIKRGLKLTIVKPGMKNTQEWNGSPLRINKQTKQVKIRKRLMSFEQSPKKKVGSLDISKANTLGKINVGRRLKWSTETTGELTSFRKK